MNGPCPRGLRIGITIGLRDAAESLWINGIKQNALYLCKLFQHSPLRHRVTLVNLRKRLARANAHQREPRRGFVRERHHADLVFVRSGLPRDGLIAFAHLGIGNGLQLQMLCRVESVRRACIE